MPDWIDYRWLIEHYGLTVTQPLRVETTVGPTRAALSDGRTGERTVQELLRPKVSLAARTCMQCRQRAADLRITQTRQPPAPFRRKACDKLAHGFDEQQF